jgi:catechol 2,3-dioxygenase-like lactoylglutathione lyase family enzyme
VSAAPGVARYRRVELGAPDPTAQALFYRDVLGLDLETRGERVEIAAGSTRLAFGAAEPGPPAHLAFLLPADGLGRAMHALDEDVRWLADPAGHTLHRFPAWRAEAAYFLDPAGHIVELIARAGVPDAGAPSGRAGILGVNELGVVVPDVTVARHELEALTGLATYGTPSPAFAAVGDARGLLIVVERGRPWFPEQFSPAEPVRARAWLDAPRSATWSDPAGVLTLTCGPDLSAG